MDILNQQFILLDSKLNILKDRDEKNSNAIYELEMSIQDKNKKIEDLEEKNKELQKEKDSEVKKLEGDKNELSIDLKKAKEELEKSQNERKDLEKKNSGLETELADLKTEKELVDAINEKMLDIIAKIKGILGNKFIVSDRVSSSPAKIDDVQETNIRNILDFVRGLKVVDNDSLKVDETKSVLFLLKIDFINEIDKLYPVFKSKEEYEENIDKLKKIIQDNSTNLAKIRQINQGIKETVKESREIEDTDTYENHFLILNANLKLLIDKKDEETEKKENYETKLKEFETE